jgi:uncharacterized membrane protein
MSQKAFHPKNPRVRKRSPVASTVLLATLILTAAATFQALAQSVWQEHQNDQQPPQSYQFVLLHAPFQGVDQTLASGVNDRGEVVGVYHDAAGPHGFVLDDGTYTPINVTLSGVVQQNTAALGINLHRDIVGSYGPAGASHGYLLHDGTFTTLDFPAPNVSQTEATGINDRGRIVGIYDDPAGSHGFLYEQAGGDRNEQGQDNDSQQARYTAIDVSFSGANNTAALGINDRDEIVGAYVSSDGHIRGFVYLHGEFHTLDVPGASETQAYGINNHGEVVGTNFLLEHRVFTPLGNLNPSAAGAVGSGINDRGEIVGITLGSSETGFLLLPNNPIDSSNSLR